MAVPIGGGDVCILKFIQLFKYMRRMKETHKGYYRSLGPVMAETPLQI